MERLELPKLKLLQPKVEAKFKVTPIRAIVDNTVELQQPRRVFRGD